MLQPPPLLSQVTFISEVSQVSSRELTDKSPLPPLSLYHMEVQVYPLSLHTDSYLSETMTVVTLSHLPHLSEYKRKLTDHLVPHQLITGIHKETDSPQQPQTTISLKKTKDTSSQPHQLTTGRHNKVQEADLLPHQQITGIHYKTTSVPHQLITGRHKTTSSPPHHPIMLLIHTSMHQQQSLRHILLTHGLHLMYLTMLLPQHSL